jgi:HAD superfamily hydrolase (TIGR01509 family)
MITTVIFDYADTLSMKGTTSEVYRSFAHKLKIPPERAAEIVLHSNELDQLMRGMISLDDFRKSLGWLIGADNETSAHIDKEIAKNQKINKDVMDIVRALKGTYKLGIISDHIKGVFESYVERFQLADYFDDIIFSGQVGARKSDGSRIFELALQRLGSTAEESIFIDDWDANITVAKSMGFNTIHFTDAGELKKELLEFGVEC